MQVWQTHSHSDDCWLWAGSINTLKSFQWWWHVTTPFFWGWILDYTFNEGDVMLHAGVDSLSSRSQQSQKPRVEFKRSPVAFSSGYHAVYPLTRSRMPSMCCMFLCSHAPDSNEGIAKVIKSVKDPSTWTVSAGAGKHLKHAGQWPLRTGFGEHFRCSSRQHGYMQIIVRNFNWSL